MLDKLALRVKQKLRIMLENLASTGKGWMMSVKHNIKRLRNIAELTQEDLATIAGVTRGAVSQWEIGESEPRMGAVQRIADHFHIKKSNIIEEGGMDGIVRGLGGRLYEIERFLAHLPAETQLGR